MVASPIGHPDASALAEAGFFGKPVNLAFESDGIFGVSAGDRFCHIDPIAWLYFGDAGAYAFNRASAIGAGCIGKRRLYGVGAVSHVGVVRIYADGMDAD